MLIKEIEIDNRKVKFKASAGVPRLYRLYFKRDVLQDIAKLQKAYSKKLTKGAEFEIADLEIFENIAYIMAKHADNSVPNTIDEWLEQFNTFSIYEVLPQILELWVNSEYSEIESKKKLNKVAGN